MSSLAIVEQHIQAIKRQLGKRVSSLRRIFLDLRYWIFFRDVALGRVVKKSHEVLFSKLHSLVESGKLICPMSEYIFHELMRQNDIATRRATIMTMEALGKGIILSSEDERIATELNFLFYKLAGTFELAPLLELVWSKLFFVMGTRYPISVHIPSPINEEVAIKFIDHVWTMSSAEMMSNLEDEVWNTKKEYSRLSDKINQANQAHSDFSANPSDLLRSEISGLLDLYADKIIMIRQALICRLQDNGIKSTNNLSCLTDDLRSIWQHCFSLSNAREYLPTLYVLGVCYSSIRWDKKRNIKDNDFVDFHHAAAALPYHSAFFTERSLANMLSCGPYFAGRNFGCQIIHEPDDAIEYVETILSDSAGVES